MSTAAPFLEVRSVVKRYHNHTALDEVSLNLQSGRIFGLLGPNGAGKTTLIRIINQIIGPDEGQLLLEGRPLSYADTHRMGYLPEERGLYKKMKIGDQALYLAQLRGLSARDARQQVRHWFTRLDIQGWVDKKVEELSKGMQQKVQFACTVLHRPDLIILDEPFSGFDPVNAEVLKQEILNLQRDGATLLFSTHRMETVEEMCQDIALIHKSKVVLSGETGEIRRRFSDRTYLLRHEGEFQWPVQGVERPSIPNSDSEKVPLSEYHSEKVPSSEYHSEKVPSSGSDVVKAPSAHSNEESAVRETRVRLTQGSLNDLLAHCIAQKIELHSVEEIRPGFHEIFIKTVKESQP
ncbi:MAG: ATP-binding cassette domain-containing protein [Bacteroidetes bacterium]|nr:ATP-binding cassette domain-containing protein [Bacteroidota bacterium]